MTPYYCIMTIPNYTDVQLICLPCNSKLFDSSSMGYQLERRNIATRLVCLYRTPSLLRISVLIAGFVSPLGYCCGHLGVAECWQTSIVNGTEVFAASCSDPSKHISWEGVHYTEAANKWVANHIVDGSLSDPPIPLTKSCHSADIPS